MELIFFLPFPPFCFNTFNNYHRFVYIKKLTAQKKDDHSKIKTDNSKINLTLFEEEKKDSPNALPKNEFLKKHKKL